MPAVSFRPVCFVIMPFGVKETGAAEPAPARVDFDTLWRLAIQPALESLGYRSVRADQDVGPLIIKEMLERLYYSDLVVADVSIANANAYYEVGIRHAARNQGCVLIAADWARPVFDLAQMRHIPYPNPLPVVDAAAAERIASVLRAAVPQWAGSFTPMRETIADYPAAIQDGTRARQLAEQLESFEAFVAELAAVRQMPAGTRGPLVQAVLEAHPAKDVQLASVALEMVKFVRDTASDWAATIAYIDELPEALRTLSVLREQRALALSKQGDHVKAIAALEALIRLSGDSPERQGLLGGRFKKLYAESVKAKTPERRFLAQAIERYERGMLLDLNDYYPSCNLPGLYRERGNEGDEARAVAAAAVARAACERALLRNSGDEWLRPTLLGLAFAERNPTAASAIARQVETELGAGWKLESTLDDLRRHVAQTTDAETRARLDAIVARLAALLHRD